MNASSTMNASTTFVSTFVPLCLPRLRTYSSRPASRHHIARRPRAELRHPKTELHPPDTDTVTNIAPDNPEPIVSETATPSSSLFHSREARAIAITSVSTVAAFLVAQLHPDLPSPIPDLQVPDHVTILTSVRAFVDGPHFAVAAGMGFSALIQALTGFGFAIVSVGALTQIPWIAHSSVFNAVQPVAATLGALTGWLLIFPELKKVDWASISTLLIASTITTPVGAIMLEYLDVNVVIRGLGALISGYVLYSVLGVDVPKKLGGKGGAWGLGFLAGALGGAFDITGPPLVVHGEAADWNSKDGTFRRNVLAVVSVNSTFVVLWDLFAGRLNDYYYLDFLGYAAPTTIIGIIIGKFLSDRMQPSTFKKVVLGTCLVMGIKLLVS